MAYPAVISLKRTVDRLLISSHICRFDSEINRFKEDELVPLQRVLENLDLYWTSSERMYTVDGRIRDTVFKLEDAIETAVSNQLLSHHQSEVERSLGGEDDDAPSLISLDLTEVKQLFRSFKQTVKQMKYDYADQLQKPLPDENKDDDDDDDDDDGGKSTSKMVGLTDVLSDVQMNLTNLYLSDFKIVSIYGMAGIGKTTIAREIFEHKDTVAHFRYRAWVNVGPAYKLKQIMRNILAQVHPQLEKVLKEGDDRVFQILHNGLKGSRYLIVLDSVWKLRICRDLVDVLPEGCNGSRVLVITRLQHGPDYAKTIIGNRVRFMNKEESWRLLREKVFGEDESWCTRQIMKAGKKIAEHCGGLPLTIVTVAKFLSEFSEKMKPEYWNKIAADKQHSVFMDAYDQMSKVLLPSYYHLPQIVKHCFLYMGVFPQDYEMPQPKIIDLWIAEEFLEPYVPSRLSWDFLDPEWRRPFEELAKELLLELVYRNVVIVQQKSSTLCLTSRDYTNEKYHLNSAFLYICIREAAKNKFCRVLSRRATEDEAQCMQNQRRLCIQNNVLFAIKDMYDLMESVSNARSLLCTGTYHQYPVPVCFGLRLLRVLDALTIRFYEFPIQVLKLVQLRYLALTYDGKLPPSISKLMNLESFIVNRHASIKQSGAPSYLPMEIWSMRKLKHLHINGSDLPEPREGSRLPNLWTLLDVSTHSCTKRVLESIPNLKKLGIRIQHEIENDISAKRFFDHISHFRGLQALKCAIMNPVFSCEFGARPLSLPILPSCLRKLTLSGLGYPWEETRVIASLPVLEVLKLRCCAFRGPKWGTGDGEFRSLKYLTIEDSDLVVWTIGDNSFGSLRYLNIRHCYKLEEIRGHLGCGKIEVVDCNPLGANCAKQIAYANANVHCSWEDKKL